MACEKQIKSACFSHFGESATLIPEFTYADGKRRADFVILSNTLHAFEIKSDVDSLQRFNGQLADYLSIFDFVSCVTTEKYISEVRARVPRCVGIFQYKDNEIRKLRNPRKNGGTRNYDRLTLLKSKELDTIAKLAGISTSKMDVHSKRTLLSEKLSKKKIDQLIKESYSSVLLRQQ